MNCPFGELSVGGLFIEQIVRGQIVREQIVPGQIVLKPIEKPSGRHNLGRCFDTGNFQNSRRWSDDSKSCMQPAAEKTPKLHRLDARAT